MDDKRKFHFKQWAKKNLLTAIFVTLGFFGTFIIMIEGPEWIVYGIAGGAVGWLYGKEAIRILNELEDYWW